MTNIDLSAIPDGPISLDRRLNVLSYELGQAIRSAVYALATKQGLEVERAHMANMRIEIADLITQCRVLAQERSWEWDELLVDGEERFYERMTELRKGQI